MKMIIAINKKHLLLFLSATLLLTSSLCFGATYYVDATNGNDSNSGLSPSLAWETITRVTYSQFNPGDQILFRRNEIWRNMLKVTSSGTKGSPIVFGAYGSGKNPVITGKFDRPIVLHLGGQQHVIIQDLTLKSGKIAGVWFDNGASNVTIDNCEMSFNKSGVFFNSNAGSSNVIQNSDIHDNEWGVHSSIHTGSSFGKETIIRGNRIYNNSKDGVHIRANFWIVEYNDVYDNGNVSDEYLGIHAYSGSATENSGDHNIIRYNKIYNQRGGGNDGAGISIDQWCDYNDIYYNISFNNDGPGIYLFDAANCKILNNVSFNNCQNSSGQLRAKGEIRITSSGEPKDRTNNTIIKNNIAYVTKTGTYAIYVDEETSNNSITIDSNNWYAEVGNWWYFGGDEGNDNRKWNSKPGVGYDLNSNPYFHNIAENDFRLEPYSLCIDSGANVNLGFDLKGTSLPQGQSIDIGAIEFTDYSLESPQGLKIKANIQK